MKSLHTTIKLLSLSLVFIIAQLISAQSISTTYILMPTIGVDAEIVPLEIKALPEGTTWDTRSLSQQVGYFTGTSWFGNTGNIALGGHSELARGVPDVFYDLDKIQVDDPITVQVDGQEILYKVVSVGSVASDDLSILMPTSYEQLTIITCNLNSYRGGDYAQRVVVKAIRA